jgi:predicted transcriptional regulator
LSKRNLSYLSDISVKEAIPHIFRRPLLDVSPDTPLTQLATFLAIGPQIYVDGLAVTYDKKPVGRIGSKHILKYANSHKSFEWTNVFASDLMDSQIKCIEADAPLSELLIIFGRTRFAFVPITIRGEITTAISIRDLLPLIVDARLAGSSKLISSQIVSCSIDTNLRDIINLMLSGNIRNIVVRHENETFVINDRKILEFLFSPDARTMFTKGKELSEIKVGDLDLCSGSAKINDLAINEAAKLLTSVATMFLLIEDSILSPWDVVMKTLGKDFLVW